MAPGEELIYSATLMSERAGAIHEQVERVANSETFRNAEVLRRLLKFLAEKSIAGEADVPFFSISGSAQRAAPLPAW